MIAEFAHPLPLIINCELLGIPVDPALHLHDLWADAAYPAYVNAAPAGHRGSSATREFLADQIAAKRKSVIGAPDEQPDLLSTLIAARDREGWLTEDELLGMTVLLFITGFETTVNLIGNATLALVTHPEQLTLLRDRPDLLPSAVEECLRYDSPLEKATFRVATEDVEYSGITLPKGAIVALILGSANRDPQFCADPDVLDITRETRGHLAFGHGLHFCPGAPLARMEAQIAIGALLQRCPDLELAVPEDELRWRIDLVHRGLRTLPVRFRPSEPRNRWPDAP
ncbi:MAG: cytochrome P450 [Egibacteraceae bacterium]